MTEVNSVVGRNLRNYDTDWSLDEYSRETGLRWLEAELIADWFPPPPARVLDLGCGAGRTTVGLAELGYEVVAVDLSEALLAAARRRNPELDFRHMDATQLAFDDASFDAVLFSYNGIDCIYPLADRIRCMREAFRVLRPTGTFLLSSHNLIGTLFCAGFFSLPNYWNDAKLLAKQWNNPACLRWFIKYQDGGGPQLLYSAPPDRTRRQVESVGFEMLEVRGLTGERDQRKIWMHQQHVHFAARKP